MVVSFRAKALVQSSPNAFAINTFLARPIVNLLIPYAKLLKLCTLLSSSFSTVWYLTIGPATNCGNKDT